jgi:hypothetical protein
MTGLEIKSAVDLYMDDSMNTTDALTAINEAISFIGDMALIFDKVSSFYEANKWYDLPSACTYIDEVNINDGYNTIYTGYRIKGNQILFGTAGNYIVHYRRQPNALTSLSNTPEVHVAYHSALVTYAKAWGRLKDDDESIEGQRLMAQWEKDIQRVFNILRRKRGNEQVLVVRHG